MGCPAQIDLPSRSVLNATRCFQSAVRVCVLLLFGISLSACSPGSFNLQVDVANKANQNQPIAVDVLVIYDDKIYEKLLELTAKEWFTKKDQIKNDLPDDESGGLDIWEWEWVPGQVVLIQTLPIRNILKAQTPGALIFAEYSHPGEHRARIDPNSDVRLALNEKSFSVQQPE